MAGLVFLAFGLLVAESVLLDDQRGMITWGAIALIVPLVIQALGVLFYREQAVQEHVRRRLRAERPWLFEHPEE